MKQEALDWRVLVVDDQVGEILWLLDGLDSRGCEVVIVTNEEAAKERLVSVSRGDESYALAIVDVMIAVREFEDLATDEPELEARLFAESKDSGLRLCRLAREKLGLAAESLPIACLTVREDKTLRDELERLDIPRFHRVPQEATEDVRGFLDAFLPPRPSRDLERS